MPESVLRRARKEEEKRRNLLKKAGELNVMQQRRLGELLKKTPESLRCY